MRASFEQLEAFVATHHEGSFSAAARKCGKVQSVISTLVANLEIDLDVELFDRSRRYPVLTPAGRALIAQAELLLERRSRFLALADALSIETEDRVTLAIAPHVKLANLGEIIRRFNQEFPSVDVDIQSNSSGEIQSYVEAGQTDLGIVVEPEETPKHLDFRPLGKLKLVCVCSTDYALSQLPLVPWDQLRLHRQILLKEAHTSDTAMLQASPTIWEVSTVAEAVDLVVSKLGWAALPLHAVDAFVQTGALKIMPLQFEAEPYVERGVDLVWSFKKPMGPATASLMESLAETAIIQNAYAG